MKSFEHGVAELQKILALGKQQWFLGAGASVESGIPLMHPLTSRVESCLTGGDLSVLKMVMADLLEGAHIEHVLSHLGDLMAIAARSRSASVRVGDENVCINALESSYRAIVKCIAETIRYGYRPPGPSVEEQIGNPQEPLVDVDLHLAFVREVFKGRSNLEPRSEIHFVTTNYDTLLEDALAMEQRVACDGFSGGAIGYWDGVSIDPSSSFSARTHRVLKLHGSVDWFRDPSLGLLRARYGVRYLSDLANILIYPQATKYLETQKDPFARIFNCFRRSIQGPEAQLLAIVGYSFGDDHINSEISAALEDPSNKTVVVAFSREASGGEGGSLPPALATWLNDPVFGSRVYAATNAGLYNASSFVAPRREEVDLEWWRFTGLTEFLATGVAK